MSADLGAEVQVASTVADLVDDPRVSLIVVLLNDGPLARELRRLGIQVTVVDETRSSALAILFVLIGLLRRNRIQIVHTHRSKDTVLGLIAAKLARVPYAVRTIHGLREPMRGWDRIKFGVYEALESVTLRSCADLVIGVSKHIADGLIRSGYPPANVTYIHNGVDLRALARTRRRDEVRREPLDRGLAERLAAEGRCVVEKRFSSVRSGAALVRAYERIVLGHARPSWTRGLLLPLARSLLNAVSRRVACALERRRMNRVRRNPEILTRAAESARSLLIVCHGNIIRSPFAAHLLAKAVGGWRLRSIGSAGLEALPGRPPHPTALAAAISHAIDLSRHTAAPVTPERVAASDLIFVMDVPQLVAIQQRYPDARSKTFLLTCLAPEVPLEIGDPVNGDESMFRACFDHIARAASPLVRALSAEGASCGTRQRSSA
jgi:protein-tyrosine-phosphatase